MWLFGRFCPYRWFFLSIFDYDCPSKILFTKQFLSVKDRLWLMVIRCRDGAAPAVMFVANCGLSHNILHSQLDCHTKFQKIWTHQNSTRDFYIPPRVAGVRWWWVGFKADNEILRNFSQCSCWKGLNMVSPPSMSTIVRKVYHIDGWAALRIFADQTVRPSLNIVKTFTIFLDSFSGGGGRVKL